MRVTLDLELMHVAVISAIFIVPKLLELGLRLIAIIRTPTQK